MPLCTAVMLRTVPIHARGKYEGDLTRGAFGAVTVEAMAETGRVVAVKRLHNPNNRAISLAHEASALQQYG